MSDPSCRVGKMEMKIELDENLPSSLVADLSALGHDVDTAPAEGLAGRPDPDVWRAAL